MTEPWPALPIAGWRETCDTLHMWTQIVGKVRLALAPPENHWWHVPLYVTARGLTTSPMPLRGASIEVSFDFLDHDVVIATSAGDIARIEMAPMSVAEFHGRLMAVLRELGVEARIWTTPVEIDSPIPFEQDRTHASYDPASAHRFWRALGSVDAVLKEFRGRFLGKSSPVHFFWGSFDLAHTRFSGRRRADPPADTIGREAYSHEVISVGFWPGSRGVDASLYAYAAPAPAGFDAAHVGPSGAAAYHRELGEFLLPYEAVRSHERPGELVLEFCQSAYEAAASLAGWDRSELDRAR